MLWSKPMKPCSPRKKAMSPAQKWQLWAARVGLVLFLLLVIAQIINLAGGRF